jgi:hypothetical protein
MKGRFLNPPEPRGYTSKRRAAESPGAPAGLPGFLKRGVPAKLKSGKPGDAHERHADQIADAAMSGNTPEAAPSSQAMLSRADLPAADSGNPVDAALLRRIEPTLGAGLSHVRVHDAPADRNLAAGMGARAFTHGDHIWMGPGESRSDLRLIAHEAAHVAQQSGDFAAPGIQKQQAATPTMTPVQQMDFFVSNPSLEADPSLQKVLAMLSRYSPTVDIGKVDFRVMVPTQSYVGSGLMEEGRSFWEGANPVIELPQANYDTVVAHIAGGAKVAEVHDVVRTVGHEMYHLYRDKTGDKSNPVMPLYQAEATRRMEEIRQRWVKFAQDPGGARELGVPKGTTVTKWEDIPEAERKKIETGATNTGVIQGLYEQTAYLVEETYVKIEEVSYLRVQQAAETGPNRPSAASLTLLANLIFRFNTALDNSPNAADFMTPELVKKAKAAMLEYLRKRYPHRADPSVDSYEVIFYLSSIYSGLAPIFDASGTLISVKPPGARVN